MNFLEGNVGELMEVWNRVDKTDPAYTKKVTQRGGFTAIDAMYQTKKATEIFGMYGKGWGLSKTGFNFSMLEATGMVIHEAVFFYVKDDKRYEFPIHNAIKPMMGAKGDEDWPKKVETNTISKALSRLGFCADVFMGDFDDQDYIQDRINEEAIEKAEDKDMERVRQAQEYNEWLESHKRILSSSPSLHELKTIFAMVYRKCVKRNDDAGQKSAALVYEKRKLELEEKENAA